MGCPDEIVLILLLFSVAVLVNLQASSSEPEKQPFIVLTPKY